MFSLVLTCKLGGELHRRPAALNSTILEAGAIMFLSSFSGWSEKSHGILSLPLPPVSKVGITAQPCPFS